LTVEMAVATLPKVAGQGGQPCRVVVVPSYIVIWTTMPHTGIGIGSWDDGEA
jgi:hypothetical protein